MTINVAMKTNLAKDEYGKRIRLTMNSDDDKCEDGDGQTGPSCVGGVLHCEVSCRQEVARHQHHQEVLHPEGGDLPSNVPGQGGGECDGQEGTNQPVDVKSEDGVGEPRAGTGQQEQLDHSQDVAGVQQPDHLPGAQLESQLQAEGDCEQHQETFPGWSVLILSSSTSSSVLVIVPLQPDCPPGLN